MPKTKAIKGFTGDNVRALSTQATEAVKKALAKYGIAVKYGGGKFGELEFKIKLTLQCEGTDGETQAMKDYRRYAESRGLPIEMLGATISISGAAYEVTGFLPNRRKNNVQLLRKSDGRVQICPHEFAIRTFNGTGRRLKTLEEIEAQGYEVETIDGSGKRTKTKVEGKGKGKGKAKKEHPLAKHPFGGECQEGCDPEKGIHIMYDSAKARGR